MPNLITNSSKALLSRVFLQKTYLFRNKLTLQSNCHNKARFYTLEKYKHLLVCLVLKVDAKYLLYLNLVENFLVIFCINSTFNCMPINFTSDCFRLNLFVAAISFAFLTMSTPVTTSVTGCSCNLVFISKNKILHFHK